MMRRFALAGVLLLLTAVALGGLAEAAPPGASIPHPKAPGQGIQAGAMSSVSGVDRAEMQLGHACPIQVPSTPGAAYSYSLVGVTDTGYVLRIGYIVLQSDGGSASCYTTPDSGSTCCSGWARWFIQILDPNGNEAYWKISRAGEANPPPASSCSSGDGTCNGYPFSFGRTSPDTWTFWFDWIAKGRIRVPGSGSKLIKVYFLGELGGTNGGLGDVMGPRTALTTYRVTGSATWQEPSTAEAVYFNLFCSDGYGARSPGLGPARNNNVAYHETEAGSRVTCDPDGTLWP